MAEMLDHTVLEYRRSWVDAGSPGPLVMTRSGYDIAVKSWEVCWHDSEFCDVPIAEFTTWQEAMDWVDEHANASQRQQDRPGGPIGAFVGVDGGGHISERHTGAQGVTGEGVCDG